MTQRVKVLERKAGRFMVDILDVLFFFKKDISKILHCHVVSLEK